MLCQLCLAASCEAQRTQAKCPYGTVCKNAASHLSQFCTGYVALISSVMHLVLSCIAAEDYV